MKQAILKVLSWVFIAALTLGTYLLLTSHKIPETPPQKARIIFYPANGGISKSWISSDVPIAGDNVLLFKNSEGRKVLISGSFTVEYL